MPSHRGRPSKRSRWAAPALVGAVLLAGGGVVIRSGLTGLDCTTLPAEARRVITMIKTTSPAAQAQLDLSHCDTDDTEVTVRVWLPDGDTGKQRLLKDLGCWEIAPDVASGPPFNTRYRCHHGSAVLEVYPHHPTAAGGTSVDPRLVEISVGARR